MHPARHISLFVLSSLTFTACAGLEDFSAAGAENYGSETTGGATGVTTGTTDNGDGDGAPGDGDGTPGTGGTDTTNPSDVGCEALNCEPGSCVDSDGGAFCDCPEGTEWNGTSCDACPLANGADHVLELEIVEFSGRFMIGGQLPPDNDYDDANIYLENSHTGDRVHLGNTHDRVFAVRVTPGAYDVVYEVETTTVMGSVMPRNHHVRLQQLGLFEASITEAIIDIPVVQVGGAFTIDGVAPPDNDYDDADVLFRLMNSSDEVLGGNTQYGTYQVNLVPGQYEVVYRNNTPGAMLPRNIGAVLGSVMAMTPVDYDVAITSAPISGSFLLNGNPPPNNDYNDANIELWASGRGTVPLGNTHDGTFNLRVIPGAYEFVYRHETGANVPQNQNARFGGLDTADDGPFNIDIPMIAVVGAMLINGNSAPNDEFDDGVVHLRGVGDDDLVLLGNTHDGGYSINLIPGDYAVYYAQETSGGTVPDNKNALLVASMAFDGPGVFDIDIPTVSIQGAFTIDGAAPPTSNYEDGRVYLRNSATDDTVLLGSTHNGGYTATIVPGSYDVFYVQEAGGEVPGNQDALIDNVTVDSSMAFDFDINAASLAGQLLVAGAPAPASASDGGQLYLRNADGDSVLLGDSFVPGFAANLVAGTYGVYYRAEGSLTMPQNTNGRFACVEVQ